LPTQPLASGMSFFNGVERRQVLYAEYLGVPHVAVEHLHLAVGASHYRIVGEPDPEPGTRVARGAV